MKEIRYLLQASRLGKTVYCDEYDGMHYDVTEDRKTAWRMDHEQALKRLTRFAEQYENAIIVKL